MALKIVVPPAIEPVSVDEAKQHCKIDTDDENASITNWIDAAREFCEGFQNRAYLAQTIEVTFDRWPCFPINLPRPPLVSVDSVKYYSTDNTEYTLADTEYFVDVDSEPGRIALNYNKVLPNTILRPVNAVKIRYQAGDLVVPKMAKQAILLLIGYWNENREAAETGSVSKEFEFSVRALLNMNRVRPL